MKSLVKATTAPLAVRQKETGLTGSPYTQVGWGNPGGIIGSMYNRVRRVQRAEHTYGGSEDSITWVYTCVKIIANAISRYPHRYLNALTDEVLETKQVPADLVKLIRYPNENMTYARMARAMQTDLELVGDSYWFGDRPNLLRQPERLYRLLPDRVKIATDSQGRKAGYVYEVGGTRIPYTLDEIIHFRTDNPLDQLYGMGTVEALIRDMDMELGVTQHVIGFFQNGARIGGVLTIDGTVPDHVFERLKEQFNSEYGGQANAHKTLIAEKALDFKQITQGPAAAGAVELQKLTKDRILKGFGVPDPLLGGLMENANYKIDEAKFIFTDQTMDPKVKDFEEMMTLKLVSKWGELKFDIDATYSDPPKVKAERAEKSKGTGTSINNLLEMQGLPKVDADFADEPLIENTLVFAKKVFEQPTLDPNAVAAAIVAGQQAEEEPDAGPEVDEDGEAGDVDELPEGTTADEPPSGDTAEPGAGTQAAGGGKSAQRVLYDTVAELLSPVGKAKIAQVDDMFLLGPSTLNQTVAAALARHDEAVLKGAAEPGPVESLKLPDEATVPPNVEYRHVKQLFDDHGPLIAEGVALIKPAMARFLADQQARILTRLSVYGPTKGAHGEATGKASMKSLTPESVFPEADESKALLDVYLPLADEFGSKAIMLPAALTGVQVSWDATNPYVDRQRQRIATQVTRINDTTRSALSEVLSVASQRGYSVRQIAAGVPKENYPGVQGIFAASDARAEVIARTESALIANAATVAAYRETGLTGAYVMDGTEDQECAEADGSTWTLEEAESNPIAHPNCVRCFAPVTSDPTLGEA